MATMRLLLVEDDPDIREVLVLALQLDSEISLAFYESGEAALADIASTARTFDMALLDYRLPGMTGIELHQKLRRLPQLLQLTTVIITASLTKEYVALFEREGVSGLIAKPFDVLAIAREVRLLSQPHPPKNMAIKWLGRNLI